MCYIIYILYKTQKKLSRGEEIIMKAYERLLNYVKILTPSNENSQTVPSSDCQFNLARILEKEMNKLGNALYEIHHMDMLAAKDQWVSRLHPLVKLALTIVFLTVTMSFQKYDLTGLLRMGIYPIVLFIVGENSFRDSIRRLRIVLPLVCFVGLFNPIFDRQVIGYIGTVPLTAGMLSMVTLMIKGI